MKLLLVFIVSMACLCLQAQDKIPAGFKKGVLVMQDSTVVSGYIRDHIRSNASVVFLSDPKGKRQRLDGTQIRSAQIDSIRYLCIKGDFFRVLSEGTLCFLQKAGDASGKPVYNGTEPLLINGTEGRLGDYFVYDARNRSLRVITRKTMVRVAVEIYNNQNK
ncbi:MAG TPA: hypothetical protein VF939_22835 [Puia sp.]